MYDVMQMMRSRQVVCLKCSHAFTIHEGTSTNAHLLRCVRCGRDKQVDLTDVNAVYFRYFGTIRNSAVMGIRKQTVSNPPLILNEIRDIRKYTFMVEHMAGSCICGASFRLHAKPRCPVCRSSVFQTAQEKLMPVSSPLMPDT
jgi:uncharacterized paraquat-inducible protein A